MILGRERTSHLRRRRRRRRRRRFIGSSEREREKEHLSDNKKFVSRSFREEQVSERRGYFHWCAPNVNHTVKIDKGSLLHTHTQPWALLPLWLSRGWRRVERWCMLVSRALLHCPCNCPFNFQTQLRRVITSSFFTTRGTELWRTLRVRT